MTAKPELKAGDPCRECQANGLDHKLRYFYINLEEQLLKCEARNCLWPHNDEVSSDEEDPTRLVEEKLEKFQVELPAIANDNDDEFILKLLEDLASTENNPSNNNDDDVEYNLDDLLPMPELLPEGPVQPSPTTTKPKDSNPFSTPLCKASILPQKEEEQLHQPLNIIINMPQVDCVVPATSASLSPTSTSNSNSNSSAPSNKPLNIIISLPGTKEIFPSKANLNFLNASKCEKVPSTGTGTGGARKSRLPVHRQKPQDRTGSSLSTATAHGFTTNSAGPNRVVTRSATMLAVFGIALSSFSLKQLLAKKHNKPNALRKL